MKTLEVIIDKVLGLEFPRSFICILQNKNSMYTSIKYSIQTGAGEAESTAIHEISLKMHSNLR